MSGWTVTTEPAVEPVTLTEALEHLRVEDDADNTYITNLITAARQTAEEYTHRQLITATYTYYLNKFYSRIELPRPKLQSVTTLKYYDTSGNQQTLTEDTDYTVVTSSEPGYIVPYYCTSWPSTRDIPDVIEIIFKAGYGNAASSVPMAIKQAILLIIGDLYGNRETVITGTIISKFPRTAESLLNPYKFFWNM